MLNPKMAAGRSKIIIKLISTNIDDLNSIIDELLKIAKEVGVSVSGPIPLPTRRMKIRVRRSPCGQGRETYDIWELRVHKRLVIFNVTGAYERLVHKLLRLTIPKTVEIELKMQNA